MAHPDPRVIIGKASWKVKHCGDCVFCIQLNRSTLLSGEYECRCAESKHAYSIVNPNWFACGMAKFSTDDAKVPEGCECPKCNEDRMDYLVWVDADLVHCESCGIDYDPSEGI